MALWEDLFLLGPTLSGLQTPWFSDLQPHHSSFSLYLHMASSSLCVFISVFFSKDTYYSLNLVKCDLFLASYISKSLVPPKKTHMRFWINIGLGGYINQIIKAFLLGLSYPKTKPNNFPRSFPFHSTPIIHIHTHI